MKVELIALTSRGKKVLKGVIKGGRREIDLAIVDDGVRVRNVCALGNLEVDCGQGFSELPISLSRFVPIGGKIKFLNHTFEVAEKKEKK